MTDDSARADRDHVAVSVVVPAFNSAATIGRTLAALDAQDLERPYEVIVVDDGSEDATVAIAEAAGPRVRVLRQDHLGPGPARNLGVLHSRGEVLAFTDSDCFPTPEWLREGVAALNDAELVQGAVEPDPTADRRIWDRTIWVPGESGLWETANLLMRRELFDRLGGFEDWMPVRIGKPLAEDVWLGWRARRAGARSTFAERALVHHAVFPRGAGGYVKERVRLMYFPPMVRKMPEIRETFCYRRWFLTPRSAQFDLALLGLAAAAALRSCVPLLAAMPYARYLRHRGPGRIPAVDVAADSVAFAALAWGSLRARCLVL